MAAHEAGQCRQDHPGDEKGAREVIDQRLKASLFRRGERHPQPTKQRRGDPGTQENRHQHERQAEREIADYAILRLHQFMVGARDFEDAITIEEYVVEVDVFPDGTIRRADQ